MANILRHPSPRLADVQCSRLRFEPGDRLIIRVYRQISLDQEKRLKQSASKWSGLDEDCILVVNALEMKLDVERGSGIEVP